MEEISDIDKESHDKILSVPWLESSKRPTGNRWGRRIADVKIASLPRQLLGQIMLIPDILDEVLLVIFRWDRYDYRGWDEEFSITLTFPNDKIYEIQVPISAQLIDGHSLRIPIDLNTTVLRERQYQNNRRIPRTVFNLSVPLHKQLSHPVRRLLKNVRRVTDLLQCRSMYFVIEDEAGEKEVASSEIEGFHEAYTALRSGAYKADLLRYYLLYKYGGIYLDDKTFLKQSLDSDIFDKIFAGGNTEPCDMFIGMTRTIEISLIGCRAGSPIMLRALETAISNIAQRKYTEHRLGITGNIMFQKIFDASAYEEINDIESVSGERWVRWYGEKVGLLYLDLSNERIKFNGITLWERQAIPRSDWPKPATYYADLWNQNLVYNDGNPLPVIPAPVITNERRREIIAYTLFFLALIGVGFLIAQYPPISWI